MLGILILNRKSKELDKFEDYMGKLTKKGLSFKDTDKEIQRRLSISRINEISNYINRKNSNFT